MPKGALNYPVTVYWSPEDEAYVAISPSWYGYDLSVASGSTPVEALQRMYEILNEQLSKHKRDGTRAPQPADPIGHEEQFYYTLYGIAEYERSDNDEARELGEIASQAIRDFGALRQDVAFYDFSLYDLDEDETE